MGKRPINWWEVKDMSDPHEYDFRNYHFEVTTHPKGDGVIIKITGIVKQIVSDDLDEIKELIMNMGNWEKMLISIMNLNKDLRISSGIEERDVEEFIIDNYRIETGTKDPSIESRISALFAWITPYDLKTPISPNTIFNLLKNAIKWTLLVDTMRALAVELDN